MPIAPDIFGIDLAGIIHNVLSPMLFDQTLIRVSSSRDPLDSTKSIKVDTSYPCKGFISEFSEFAKAQSNIQGSDKNIVIIAKSLPTGVVPEHGDRITAEGATYTIVGDGVERDPAGATYSCQSR
jgi:hypothetical protein